MLDVFSSGRTLHCTESTFHWSLDKALMPLSDINGGSTEGLILIVLVNVDCVSVGDGRVLSPLPGLVVIIDHDEVVITGLLGAVLSLLFVLVEDDVLLYLVASGVINITRVRVSLNVTTVLNVQMDRENYFPPDPCIRGCD